MEFRTEFFTIIGNGIILYNNQKFYCYGHANTVEDARSILETEMFNLISHKEEAESLKIKYRDARKNYAQFMTSENKVILDDIEKQVLSFESKVASLPFISSSFDSDTFPMYLTNIKIKYGNRGKKKSSFKEAIHHCKIILNCYMSV